MKYFKQVVIATKKLILISLAAALGIGAVIAFLGWTDKPFWVPLCIALGIWLVLWILLIFLVSSSLKKDEPLNEILEAQGYCDAWLQKHSEIYPNPTRAEKLRRVEVLSYLDRYDEAKALLDSIPTVGLNDTEVFQVHNARLDMLLTTGHYAEAANYFAGCQKFMDIYSQTNPLYGAVYGLNAGVILAIQGDYNGSEHYIGTAEKIIQSKSSMSPAMVQIARTMQLYALGFTDRAEAQEEKTYQSIMQDPQLAKQWQKDHFLKQLGKAQYLTPEKRQEG